MRAWIGSGEEAVVTSTVQVQYVEQMRAELADLDERLPGARSQVESAQKEVDLLAAQHSELAG